MADDRALDFTLTSVDQGRSLRLPNLRVIAILPDRGTVEAPLGMSPVVIGTSTDCDLILTDPRVSRRHCELRITERGVLLRDLRSKNGTLVGGASMLEALLPPGVPVTVGGSEITVQPAGAATVLPLSSQASFGGAIGHSLPMRVLFGKLQRAALTDETILLLGESGTGKEVLAMGIHESSRRAKGPFVVFDCGAITPSLIEDELFGHVRGAFTNATSDKPGLFELASGGTLFIDEIGELPLELQPKLLRAIESREARRLGATGKLQPFDARIVAATHRNLKTSLSEGAFRQDLYYRIAVVEVIVPALRERKDDIQMLVERFLAARDPPRALRDLPPHTIPLLQAYDWPGNVRELRNAVARLVLFPELLPELIGPAKPQEARAASQAGGAQSSGAPAGAPPDAKDAEAARLGQLLELPLAQAREVVLEELERSYVAVKLRQHGGNITHAAAAMGVSRPLLHRLLDRYGMRAK